MSAARPRIAVAGFMHESNTFNPLRTDRSAFARQSLLYGLELVREWRAAHHEVGGFLESVEAWGAELLPLVMAWATPSGPVTADIFDEVTAYLCDQLKQLRPDGLLLALHGAMVCEAHRDADGEIAARLRRAAGPALPTVATLDLHGNISQRLVDNTTALVAYRTNPHVDQRECGQRAAQLLRRILTEGIQPRQALVKPPVIVNIMVHDTSVEPLHSFMERTRALEAQPGILAASLLPGFAYSDVPQMGPAIIVVADGDAALAQREAETLGRALWEARASLTRTLPEAPTAVRQALQSTQTPVVLVDTGDNVGGGSSADGTVLLQALLDAGATEAVVCLYAPDEVRQCVQAGVGEEVRLTVGGKVDRLHGAPVALTGRVKQLHDGLYVEAQVRHGGKRLNNMGLTAVVTFGDGNLLVLNTLRHPPFSLGQPTCLGIQPERMRVLVVKAAIAYKAAYRPVAGSVIEVDTPGTTAVNPWRFEYRHIRRPMYPLDGADGLWTGEA